MGFSLYKVICKNCKTKQTLDNLRNKCNYVEEFKKRLTMVGAVVGGGDGKVLLREYMFILRIFMGWPVIPHRVGGA